MQFFKHFLQTTEKATVDQIFLWPRSQSGSSSFCNIENKTSSNKSMAALSSMPSPLLLQYWWWLYEQNERKNRQQAYILYWQQCEIAKIATIQSVKKVVVFNSARCVSTAGLTSSPEKNKIKIKREKGMCRKWASNRKLLAC